MKVKEFWNRVLSGKDIRSNVSPSSVQVEEEEKMVSAVPHNYGLDMIGIILWEQDYGWNIKPFKKVTLVNPKDCENRIDLMGLVAIWRGTGHSEWEFLLAYWFIKAVLEALNNGEDEADISMMFDRDFTASNNRILKQEKVHKHILPYFEKVSNTEDELKLKFKIG